MGFDTNPIIAHIRRHKALPPRALIPVIVVGELEAFALKADWGHRKVSFMRSLFERYPIVEITKEITIVYAQIDAYSQGRLYGKPLPQGLSARNMGRNDIWIAAIALYLGIALRTTDLDFNHLTALGLQLSNPSKT